MQMLLDNPEERRHWAERAAVRAQQLYRWDAVAAKYEELFEEVLSKR
jgi:glycosyltransferase involved in cell wall biosynthesis